MKEHEEIKNDLQKEVIDSLIKLKNLKDSGVHFTKPYEYEVNKILDDYMGRILKDKCVSNLEMKLKEFGYEKIVPLDIKLPIFYYKETKWGIAYEIQVRKKRIVSQKCYINRFVEIDSYTMEKIQDALKSSEKEFELLREYQE